MKRGAALCRHESDGRARLLMAVNAACSAKRMMVYWRNPLGKEDPMYLRHVLTVALVLGCAAPAFAAKNVWIVRGPDQKCRIVEKEPAPADTTIVKVGKDVYVTREEAEADMKIKCKS